MGREGLGPIAEEIVACAACPRLRRYCTRVAATGKREFAGWRYWGKPVPGFGDRDAAVLIVGLAPAAHGANRTGRMFTGDSSGTWLVRAMYRAGFANQPTTIRRGDGLRLRGAFLTAAVRCAPPDNQPRPDEVGRCVRFLAREMAVLHRVRVIVTLGQLAFTVCRRLLRTRGAPVGGLHFAHGVVHPLGTGFPIIVASYHPSRQNTNTGRLTEPMLDAVFQKARDLAAAHKAGVREEDGADA